jgi:hypothetical protein
MKKNENISRAFASVCRNWRGALLLPIRPVGGPFDRPLVLAYLSRQHCVTHLTLAAARCNK